MLQFTKRQKEVLTYFFINPTQSHYVRELAGILDVDPGNLSKELKNLSKNGFVMVQKRGALKFFSINKNHPLHKELHSIFLKTIGIKGSLRQVLKSIPGIEQAYIYGSFAKQEFDTYSDIDLMIIGTVDEDVLAEKISSLEKKLGREINDTIFHPREYNQKSKEPFLKNVLQGKKIIIIKRNEK